METKENVEMMISFLYQSIVDIQDTIRAMDTKLGLLIIFIGLPFSSLGKISDGLKAFIGLSEFGFIQLLLFVIILMFVLLWVCAFYCALKGIVSIDGPSCHIPHNDNNHLGRFYRGGNFSFKIIDCFRNREKILAKESLENALEKLPKDAKQIIDELLFEQSKLIYIREIKSHRQKWAFRFNLYWLMIGALIYLTNILSNVFA